MAIKPKLMVQYIILELRILSCNNGNIIRNIVGLCKAAHSKHILPLQSLLALGTVIKILRKANDNLQCLPNSKFILAQLIRWPIVHKLKSGKQTRVTFNDCHLLRLTHNWFLSVILPTTLEMIGYILINGYMHFFVIVRTFLLLSDRRQPLMQSGYFFQMRSKAFFCVGEPEFFQ